MNARRAAVTGRRIAAVIIGGAGVTLLVMNAYAIITTGVDLSGRDIVPEEGLVINIPADQATPAP